MSRIAQAMAAPPMEGTVEDVLGKMLAEEGVTPPADPNAAAVDPLASFGTPTNGKKADADPNAAPAVDPNQDPNAAPKAVDPDPNTAPVFALPEALKETPEFKEVTTLEAYHERVQEMAGRLDEEVQANEKMADLLDKHPAITKFLRLIDGGKLHVEAYKEAFGTTAEAVPDPEADPEGYRKWVREDAERAAEMKLQRQRETEASEASRERAKRVEAQARADLAAFQTEANVPKDELPKFMDFARRLVYGDPKTGELPRDMWKRLWQAYKYEDDVKRAQAAGRTEGVIDATRRRAGDGLPHPQTAGAPRTQVPGHLTTLATIVGRSSRVPAGVPITRQ
jgi:hypothetical protein